MGNARASDSTTGCASKLQTGNAGACSTTQGFASNCHHGSGHTHNIPSIDLKHIDLTNKPLQRLIVYMMEVSIMVHSVLVGLALGVLSKRVAVLSLGSALLFHQFFEGLALGAVAVKSSVSLKTWWHLVLTFSLSCPLGAVLGIFVSNQYDAKDYWTAWVLGTLNALAAGTLLH